MPGNSQQNQNLPSTTDIRMGPGNEAEGASTVDHDHDQRPTPFSTGQHMRLTIPSGGRGGWTRSRRFWWRRDGLAAERGGAGERAEVSDKIEVAWRNRRAEPREQRDRLSDKALDASAGGG